MEMLVLACKILKKWPKSKIKIFQRPPIIAPLPKVTLEAPGVVSEQRVS